MPQLTWEEVAKRGDLIDGDIESQEDGAAYRGPIKEVILGGSHFVVIPRWTAERVGGRWRKMQSPNPIFVDTTSCPPPLDIGAGRIHFELSGLGHVTIFPRGGSKLDPAEVEGLEPVKT